ncbi:tRNA pseudouridine synthase C [compost metagenome]
MDQRLPALADQLLLIERELRALGMWALEPPSDAALASSEPFCVDTLAFEEWLQWIFLPRMKLIIEIEAELPHASGIRAMAEMVYAEQGARVLPLLDALGTFDRLISEAS